MKRFLTFLALCCLMAAGAWAERYHIYQNNGTLHTTGSSTFCSQWTSTQTDPQISINVTDGNGAANDMQNNSTYADGGIVCYTGNDRDKQGYKATLTVAASHGYNITGYEFDASSLTDGCTISVSDGTTTKTLTGTTAQTISKTGVNAQNFVITIQCTAGSNRNTAVLFNNFYVTYEAAEPIENEYKVVFETPSSGTPYRIPAVAQAQNGDLIFVSDYRYSKADIGMATNGELDLKVRKKKANGTWEDEKTLQRCITTAPFTAFGDPCIVVDNTPGNPGKVMVTSCCGNVSYPHGSHSNHQGWARWYSTDNGDTWSSYTDISQQVVNQVDQRTGAKLAAFFIGSGKISQSKTIKVNNYNRLYCASLTTVSPDGADANKATMNYVWYSDDFGENWHMLGTPDGNPINGGNEPKAEELPDGSVLISSRTSGGRIYNIWHYTDTEAGKGYWGTQQKCTATYGADCNGEILVVPVTRASNSEKTYLLLQSIPADANRNYVSIYWKELTDLTKYRTAAELSNGGWTKFPVSTTTSAYSTMCQMKDGHIAFFYEEYDHNSGYDMVYKNFSVEEITNNAYSYSTLDATEKANYLTNGVGAYFDGESSAVQALAATYKAAPDADKYDALNAALQSPDELYFTPGWYRIKVGSGSAQKQAEYKGRYLYGKPLPDTWPIGVTDNANDLRTYVYITGTHDKWHIEFNHDTDAAYFATHDCKNSATPGNLSFIPNSEGTEWKIWGNNSYRWMGWYLNSTPSIGSTSTGNETNNGCYFVFEKVDAPVLVAGKVYKIKAKFATGTSDIYLSAGSTGMTLPTAEATTPQSYWIARTTNDATYPWKFQSGYGNGKYLSVANGVSETASTFDVRICADVSGTYHLWNSQSGGRYIGTYSSTNSKHGFGDFDGKGCWADGHHAGSDYTTDYIFEEVQNVTAYTVCGEGSLNVTGITGYTYASEISAGGVVIVPSNITPTATNFTTPDGLIAIVNTDAKTITLSKTYKKGVAVTQQSDLQDGDLVIVDVKAKNATTDAVLYYVGESTSMSNRNNFRAHINNVTEYPANHVWEVVDVNTSTTPNTFKLRSVADNTVYLPSGNTTSATNTAATFYFKESTGYNDGVNRFALAFSNNENADHYTYHFNAQPATGQGEPICFWGYGAASTDSQGAFAFYKVAEDIPTAEISLDNTTVTSSQLSELTITFTGANAAQVQLSATQHTAYLTPKASTPAQVKAQNGKLKAAPAGAIEGNISATDETGKFSINFGDADIAAGDYELTIPEGTFLVGTTPVPELTANYTVEEPAPIPTAGRVYTIKANFPDQYTDLYLAHNGSEKLQFNTTATDVTNYWVARASGEERPWKFQSGYGDGNYLDGNSNNAISTTGAAYNVGSSAYGFHMQTNLTGISYAGLRYIGTWESGTKSGYGKYNGAYGNNDNYGQWTTHYEIEPVPNVTVYDVVCETTDGGVAPKFSNYAGVATVKDGGIVIVPNGTTLDATNFPAAEISGYTGSVTFNGTTITVTYEASATPDGFHIYESNGTYSNTNNQSEYKDKWLSKGTNPQFTILVTQASGSGAANNMYHNETYKDSGILCFTGDAHINNKSMMTVSVQNGYKITGYTFKVKNLEGATAGNTKVVTTAGQTINTTADNQTVVVSGLEDVTSFTITLDGSNGSRNEGIVFTDFYVTYEGEPVVEVPTTGIYYIYDNNKSGYLYNNSITSEGTSELTETLTGTKVTDDNRYLWRVVSDGSSTSITLTNGQGTGYKVSDADETHTVDLASVNWKFEELPMITIRPQGKPAYDEYPVHYVSVKYKSKTEAIEKVLDEGYAKYTDGNTQYAHNGGFLVSRDDWTASKYGYGDASSRICEEDGLPFTKCRIYTNADTENTNHWWYYTQQDEDLITEIQQKITYFPYETDMLGLVEESSIPWDNENLMAVVYAAMADWFEAYEYKEMLGRFNRLVAAVEVVKPTIGNGYKLYVKDKDGNKYYLANDKVTANADEAEVYVVGGTDDESCNYLFASNNNGASNYLPNMSSAGSTYEEDACAYKIQGMGQITGENIEEEAAFLYGSFLLTNAEGNILNAITGSSASLNPRTEPYVVYGESSTETSAIWMEEVEYPYNKPTLAKGSPDDHDGGYASIWLPFPMLFPDGVEAYRATSVENDGVLILTKVNTDRMVAAGGYILRDPDQKDDKASWTVLPAAANPKDVTPFEDNAFVGSTEKPLEVKEEGSWAAFREKHPDGTAYVLARKNGVIGYYKYKETETYLPKGKAIWFSNYEPSTSTECMQFSFGDIVEAIKALNGEATDAEIYDLQGHRLNKAVKGQVNVINGKKVMFK